MKHYSPQLEWTTDDSLCDKHQRIFFQTVLILIPWYSSVMMASGEVAVYLLTDK